MALPYGCVRSTRAASLQSLLIVGVEDIELVMSKETQTPTLNRGFCFVEFYNHDAAELAKAALSSHSFKCVTSSCSPLCMQHRAYRAQSLMPCQTSFIDRADWGTSPSQ